MARSAAGLRDHCQTLSIYEPSHHKRRVFVKTSLGTNLLVLTDPQQTVSDLQREPLQPPADETPLSVVFTMLERSPSLSTALCRGNRGGSHPAL